MPRDKAYLVVLLVMSLVVVGVTMAGVLPWWVGVVIFVPLVVSGLILKRHTENKRLYVPQPVFHAPPPHQPVQPATTTVRNLALPSVQRDYRFLLDATVLWRHSGAQGMPHPRPDQLAIDAIRERAIVFTEREPAADIDLLAPRLAAELSFPRPDRTGLLEVWAQDAALSLPDDDRERLRKLAGVRKDEEVWEYERAYERNKRTFLREDVLSSTGSAVVWWLARDTSRVQETVDLIGTLAKLVAAAQDREVEPVFRTFVNSLTDPSLRTNGDDFVDLLMAAILPNGSEPERADMADRLATLATDAGATDLAHTIRERFNAPDFTGAADTSPGLFDTPPASSPSPIHPNGQPDANPSTTPPNPL
ncbi:hypothetical protein [Actinophytocola sp.]|uniref:hypothetical protein n=1 Tax=Actinophytocola sp. TaxID=1872138 RepID=UPI002ED0E2FF